MNNGDYQKLYAQLGIVPLPLPENYNPNAFGKSLMDHSLIRKHGVTYAAHTTPYVVNQGAQATSREAFVTDQEGKK